MINKKNKEKNIFDLHLDLSVYREFSKFLKMNFSSLNKFDSQRHGDLIQFHKARLKIAVTNIFPFEYDESLEQWIPVNFEKVKIKLKNFLFWLNKYKNFQIIFDKEDLIKIISQKNKIGLILGVEGLNFVKNQQNVFELYNLGIRVFGLNWNVDSSLSTSLKTNKNFGLTEKGKKIIDFIEKLPVVLDLVHSSIYTINDVFKIYKKPLIFSHNGYKKIVNFEQNLDEKILLKIKKNNGLLGLTLLPNALRINNKVSFSNWLQQYQSLKPKYVNNLAIGTDFFGFDFNSEFYGCSNYLEFGINLQKYKVIDKILFNNAYNLFKKLI